MGTHKGPNAKGPRRSVAKKRKPSTKLNIANPISRPRRPPRRPGFTKAWEEWEDNIVVEFRREGKTAAEINQRLPHRTFKACEKRLRDIKARRQKARTQGKDALVSSVPERPSFSTDWEAWEDQILVAHRAAGWTYKNITRILPHRTLLAVKTRANREEVSMMLRLNPPPPVKTPESGGRSFPWNQEEDQVLRSLRESGKTFIEIAKRLPSRTPSACQHHFELIRQDTRKRRPYWAEWEERLLVSGYFARLTWEEISRRIPGRTKTACNTQWWKCFRATDLNDPWTAEEIALLQNLRAQGSSWKKISKELPGHSSNACRTHWYKEAEGIQGALSEHGVKGNCFKGVDCLHWSKREVETLVSLYNTIGPRYEEICKHLPGRTEMACESHLRLKCTKEDGVGGPPSEFWEEYFANKPAARGAGSAGSEDDPTPRLRNNQQRGMDARKRKLLEIPMV